MRRLLVGLAAVVLLVFGVGQAVGSVYTFTDLGNFGGLSRDAYGINASGQVVGAASNSSGDARAFLYSNGVMTDLGILPGQSYSSAFGINCQRAGRGTLLLKQRQPRFPLQQRGDG